MAEVRESVFVPTIKCSSCAMDVEISMMGDHLCGGAADYQQNEQQTIEIALDDRSMLPPFTYGERMPPVVDTKVANHQYMRSDQYTPNSSSSGSRSMSPRTPTVRSSSGKGGDYFVPQIASDYPRTLPPSQGPIMGGYGQYDEPESYDDFESPRKQASGAPYQQMDAAAPGFYNIDERSLPPSDYTTGQGYLSPTQYSTEPSSYQPQPSLSGSNPGKYGNGEMARSGSRAGGSSERAPTSRAGNPLERAQAGTYLTRSDTFPKASSPITSPTRKLSAPTTTSERFRQGNPTDARKRPPMGPVTTRAPPPRTNIVRSTPHITTSSIDLAAEFGVENPYHTPTESTSSGFSATSSQSSHTTYQSSPSKTTQPRKPQDSYNSYNSYNDEEIEALQSSMASLRPTDLRIDPTAKPAPGLYSEYPDSPIEWSGTVSRNSPNPSSQYQTLSPTTYSPAPRPGASPRTKTEFSPSAAPRPVRNDSLRARTQTEASPISPLSQGSYPQRKDSHDLSALPYRGDCKSCHLPIRGKSISSADGRLTGKYHKACFVCSTCFEPFTSAEFYVLNDKPFCERHYHKLNGSLCGSCGRGIEGQYLEDEAKVKYHPGCFRCLDCGLSLSDGYFEVDGKSYCERHAWRRVQHAWNHQPGRRQAEANDGRPPPPPKGPSASRPPRSAGGLPSNPAAPKVAGGSGQQNGGRYQPSVVLMGLEPPPAPRLNKRSTRLGMI
ncbi:Paxillin-like protein 1 [Paramyrothecium foliicola]|nr:Paxillin-like protein 1 [Paramyrothecium foliicola]